MAIAGPLMEGDAEAALERKKAARRRARERKKAAKNAERAEEQKQREALEARESALQAARDAEAAVSARVVDVEAQNRVGQVAASVARATGMSAKPRSTGRWWGLFSFLSNMPTTTFNSSMVGGTAGMVGNGIGKK